MVDQKRIVAVLDVGKTNVKVVLHDTFTARDFWVRTVPNLVLRDGPYPHFDIARIEAFFIDSLADAFRQHPDIGALSITAHGATGALIGADRLAMPVLDYEYEGPTSVAEAYDRIRPDFSETYSPRLPNGLNLGAQVFWQAQAFPALFEATRAFVTYAQYWSWWLTGVAATEPTSLGSHTDFWNPRQGTLSSLVGRAGWADRMAPLRSAFDVLGPVRPEIARRIGLVRPLPVSCGIHDSNASLLPHLLDEKPPLSVVSSGTWAIVFAPGGSLDGLDRTRDTLANVDAFGNPTPSARFMGGREFDLLTGRHVETPDAATMADVVERQIMALPTFSPGNGPFPAGAGRWSHPVEDLSVAQRTAGASLYVALMTVTCLDLLEARGPTIVEGPFASNDLYRDTIAALTGRPVIGSKDSTGTSAGAVRLVSGHGPGQQRDVATDPLAGPPAPGAGLKAYADVWRKAAAAAH
jgi:sugar (pentulose or hexulose) kinase